jgi:hypothetical protein
MTKVYHHTAPRSRDIRKSQQGQERLNLGEHTVEELADRRELGMVGSELQSDGFARRGLVPLRARGVPHGEERLRRSADRVENVGEGCGEGELEGAAGRGKGRERECERREQCTGVVHGCGRDSLVGPGPLLLL